MATYYSDHFATSGADTTTRDATYRPPVGIGHGKMYYKVAHMSAFNPQTTDTVRVMSFKSGDRLNALLISCDATPSAGAVNIGLYLAGDAHDGAVIDADLFVSAQAITSALDQTDAFNESAVLANTDRGKTLWELAAIGAASYTADPMLVFDVVMVPSTNFDADSIITIEAYYTAAT